jgi:hypothetical protein
MSFFLTEEMEEQINLFLNTENEQICKAQLESPDILPEFKEMIRKTIESGSPVPYFDTRFGYYSVSFTPCEYGNRVYIHHHISDKSEVIFDPSQNVPDPFNAKDTLANVIKDDVKDETQDLMNDPKNPFEQLQLPTIQYNIDAEQMMQNMMSAAPPSSN